MEREYKTFPAKVIAVDEAKGIVETIFSVFGNIDEGLDIVHPGSFTKTFVERGNKVRVLDHHNTNSIMDVIGKPIELRELGRSELPKELLLKCPESTGGAYAKVQMLMDTPEGRGAFIRLRDKAVDEWSFGYDVLDKDFSSAVKDNEDVTVRNLRTLKLWELSPVIWGMNPITDTIGAKGAGVDKSVNLSERISAVRNAFREQFNPQSSDGIVTSKMEPYLYINTVYDDHLIVEEEGSSSYFKVTYTQNEDGVYQFAPKTEWTEGEFVFVEKIKTADQAMERKQELVDTLRAALVEAEALLSLGVPAGEEDPIVPPEPDPSTPAEVAGRDDNADDQGAGPEDTPPTAEETERVRQELLTQIESFEED